MALSAGFWTGGGAAVLWHDLSTFNSGLISGGPDGNGMWPCWIGPLKIYQEPSVVDSKEGRFQDNPGHDAGFFYGVNTTSGAIQFCDSVFLIGYQFSFAGTGNGQWVWLEPYSIKGDLMPISPNHTSYIYSRHPVYKTGFLMDKRPTHLPATQSAVDISVKVYADGTTAGTYRMHHYSPYAWAGTVPEVIAAAAMHAGVAASDIYQQGFSDAFDAYDLSLGDSPWDGLTTRWTVYARRIVGQGVADFLLRVAEHGRDYIFVNEAGQLALSSRTRPTHVVTGFTLKGDGVLKVLSWDDNIRHTFNSVRAGWGSAARQSWEDSDGYLGGPGSKEMTAAFEPHLEGHPGDKWYHEASNYASRARYGPLWLPGKRVVVNYTGQPQEVELVHFPFLLTPHSALAPGGYSWDPAVHGGGMVHVTHWLNSDSQPRAEIEIEQDARGFDMGIGDKVINFSITGDGEMIGEARVISRDYDFDSLTMRATLLEVPSNL